MRGTREECTPVDPARTAGEGKASSTERVGGAGRREKGHQEPHTRCSDNEIFPALWD